MKLIDKKEAIRNQSTNIRQLGLSAIAITIALLLLPVTTVAGEDQSASEIDDFDGMSLTGIENADNREYFHSPPYSIKLTDGEGWFNFENEFTKPRIECFVYFDYDGDGFQVVIQDNYEAEKTNYIEIEVTCAGEMKGQLNVRDYYGADDRSTQQTQYIHARDTWFKLAIWIDDTEFYNDGIQKGLYVEMDGVMFLEGWQLFGPGPREPEARKYDYVKFVGTNSDDPHAGFVDDINIETETAGPLSLNWWWILIFISFTIVVVAVWRLKGHQTMRKKTNTVIQGNRRHA